MKEVHLVTPGYIAYVDDEDFEFINSHRWYAIKLKSRVYAYTPLKENGTRKTVYMHKLVTSYNQTDHIDGNGLNNCRSNLRPTTHILNQGNASWSNNTSGYRGVGLTLSGKWMARLNTKTVHKYLGSFETKEEAARAYDAAALEYFGNHAKLNFPKEKEASTE